MPAKPSTKSSVTKKLGSAATKGHHPTHPSWADMISECIVAHPADARAGVSRPTIKKFVGTKYHIDMNTSAASQLNKAIAHGAEKGTFVLPKGPSGKVKLAGKGINDAAKENTKPAAKRPATTKIKSITAKKSASTKKPLKAKTSTITATKPKAAKTPTAKPATTAGTTKKYTSTAKKAKTMQKVKSTAAKKSTAKKASTAKKPPAKKAVTGELKPKKIATKPKPKAVAAKAASKAKPVSKSSNKSASKAKPASKKA